MLVWLTKECDGEESMRIEVQTSWAHPVLFEWACNVTSRDKQGNRAPKKQDEVDTASSAAASSVAPEPLPKKPKQKVEPKAKANRKKRQTAVKSEG